jgi:hypothetical protein
VWQDVAKNQKGRVFGPALLTENNFKIFSVFQGSAADITLDTHTETAFRPVNDEKHTKSRQSAKSPVLVT